MNREEIKSKFITGYKITQQDYSDWVDSIYFKNDAVSGEYFIDAGVLIKPTFTDNANGSITLGTGTYILYTNTTSLPPSKFVIEGNTFVLTDQSLNYVTANYNNGNPIIEVSTSRSNINQLNVIPLYTIYRNGINLVYLDWDHQSIGLANKISDRLVRTRRYEAEPGGLTLGEAAGRVVTITAGAVWSGGNKYDIDSYRSDIDSFIFSYHVNGVWVKSNLTTYNNLQYDDGTNLQTLANNSYGVVWIIKRIGTPSNCACMVLGTKSYTLSEALIAKVPSLPPELVSLGLVIGRIIVQKGASTAYQIDSIFDTQFGNTSVNDHLKLSNLQGGQDGEYYHLTSEEYNNILTTISTSGINLSLIYKGDWNSSSTYDVYDAVTYDGSIYYAISENINQNPSLLTHWKLAVSKGDTGEPGDSGSGGIYRYDAGEGCYVVATVPGIYVSKPGGYSAVINNPAGSGTIISICIHFTSAEATSTSCIIDFGTNIGTGINNDYTNLYCPQFQVFQDVPNNRAMKMAVGAHLNAGSNLLTLTSLTSGQAVWINLSF